MADIVQAIRDVARVAEQSPYPLHVEDHLTNARIYDVETRKIVQRAFLASLRQGGEHARIAPKVLRSSSMRLMAGVLEIGKPTLAYKRETAPTTDLLAQIDMLDGRVPEVIRDNGIALANFIAAGTGRIGTVAKAKLMTDKVEEIMKEVAALKRENDIHAEYQQTIKDLINRMPKSEQKGIR